MDVFPKFTIKKVEERSDRRIVSGQVTSTKWGESEWVGDGWVGCLMKNQQVAFGRWRESKGEWEFTFDEGEDQKLSPIPGDTFEVLDGYWGERAELVYDEKTPWQPTLFVEQKQWDHDHCSICWATISAKENTEYYKKQDWVVCEACFASYVELRILAFIENA